MYKSHNSKKKHEMNKALNSTQLNVYSLIRQTRDTVIIHQMHGRLPERPKPIYAGHP